MVFFTMLISVVETLGFHWNSVDRSPTSADGAAFRAASVADTFKIVFQYRDPLVIDSAMDPYTVASGMELTYNFMVTRL